MTLHGKERVNKFVAQYPLISPALTRFPIAETFWESGIQRILWRFMNYYFTHRQMLSKKDKIIGYPSHIFLDVTNICTLKCPLCPTGLGVQGRKKGHMSFSQFKNIIDEIGKYLISIDLFNWGEPLLNKDVYRMIEYAHQRKILTAISTNFQHFSEGGAEEMISSRLDNLILSIDGASQESYEKYRIGGNFQTAIDNISVLVKKKKESAVNHPYIYWQFLVMRHNEHEIEKASEMARELGVDKIGFDHAYLPVETRGIAMQCLPQNSKYHRYNLEELEKKWQSQEKQTQSPEPMNTSSTESYKRLINCSWLWTQTTINWDGGISPCCAIWDPSHDFGNITEKSFREVWNNDKYKASRNFSAKGEVDTILTTCMICPFASHG